MLGTEFNVRAYSDLPSTTLSGRACLIRDKGTKSRETRQQAVKGNMVKWWYERWMSLLILPGNRDISFLRRTFGRYFERVGPLV